MDERGTFAELLKDLIVQRQYLLHPRQLFVRQKSQAHTCVIE